MQAQRWTIPDNMKLRPGDTVVWEIGQGRHSVLFRPFGPGQMLDFNNVKEMFDFDLSQFVSTDPKEAFTKDERTPGKQLLTGKVKPEAVEVAKLAERLPFWCEIHEQVGMSGVLEFATAAPNPAEPARTFRVKAMRNLTWILSDGQQEIVLPKIGGASAISAGCPCCSGMMAGMRRTMGGMGGMMGDDRMGGSMSGGGMEGGGMMGCGMQQSGLARPQTAPLPQPGAGMYTPIAPAQRQAFAVGDPVRGEKAFATTCAGCHASIGRIARRIEGNTPEQKRGWLDAFLTNHNAPDESTRADLIAFLLTK
jgi:plastocyanin/mono/diheme cytochrome c family protein